MPRYKLTVAYDGTNFHGWQKQQQGGAADDEPASTEPPTQKQQTNPAMARDGDCETDELPNGDAQPLRTAQGVLERAVRFVVREPVDVTGASRTDAGVHARAQVAAFTAQALIPVKKLPRAISSRLPDDIQVTKAEIVADDFDPTRGAIAKGYRYRIVHGCARERSPLFDRHFVMHTAHRLDPERMNEAARRLLGEHDFTSFTRLNHGRESTVRTIYECKVTATRRRRCELEIAGNGFLYNMVRIIAGTLLEVGRGTIEPEMIPRILDAKDRRSAGPTLPPSGLCLMWVRYADSSDGAA